MNAKDVLTNLLKEVCEANNSKLLSTIETLQIELDRALNFSFMRLPGLYTEYLVFSLTYECEHVNEFSKRVNLKM